VLASAHSATNAAIDFAAPADLYPCRYGKNKRPIGYKRFDTLAEAIRFAVEELPAPLLNGTYLESNDLRFNGDGIRALYEREDYPLREAEEGLNERDDRSEQ
jgi:hypothetical protein